MTQVTTLPRPLTRERVGGGVRHGLREVLGPEAWSRLPEAVRERFADATASASYAGAFEVVRASALGRVFAWLGTLFGTPVAPRAETNVAARVLVRPDAHGVAWNREYLWADGTRHLVRSTKVVTDDGLLIEKLPARLCMPLDTFEEGGVLHFVSRGYYFDLGLGTSALAADAAVPRRHARRTHRSRARMVPLHDDRDASVARRSVLPDRALLRRGGIAMTLVFSLLTVQTLLGALDTLWNHELVERLPSRRAARHELALHAAREFVYVFVFLALAWREWHGSWALLIAAALLLEVAITATDFVVEDRTRRLSAFERVLHTAAHAAVWCVADGDRAGPARLAAAAHRAAARFPMAASPCCSR